MKHLLPALLAPFLILLTDPAQAKVFRNAYIAFEMPETWKCNLEVTEWVCRAEQGKESKEAIIILTAKEVGPTDSFALYEHHLNTPVPLTTKAGTTAESNIVYKSKNVTINDQTWIDGLHLSSEVSNYFTRYLATIKDKIAILVTLSAHKNYYTRYSQEFFKTVMSLKVVATKFDNKKPDFGIRPGGGEGLGPGSMQGAVPADIDGMDPNGEGGTGNGKNSLVFLALGLAAIGLLLFLRKRRQGRK